MRKLLVSEFITLDGVVESPQDWQFDAISDDLAVEIQASIHEPDVFLFGRNTYEEHASFWPTQTHNEFGIADKLNNTPKIVVSTTLQKAEWNNTTIIKDNVIEAVTKLKQQPGGTIGMDGSATLIHSLMQADLIDEYHLLIHPIVVGKGKRLFDAGIDMTRLKLVKSQTFKSGVVLVVYQPDRSAS